MASSNDTRTLRFSCACGQTSGSFNIPEHDLPLPLTLCHCYTCRHQSGLLFATNTSVPHGADFHVGGPLECYKVSEELSRFFCGSCGANVYLEDSKAKRELCSGLLEEAGGASIPRLHHHIFVKDTKDGGGSVWFPGVDAWEEFSETSAKVHIGAPSSPTQKQEQKQGGAEDEKGDEGGKEEKLLAHCSCKGVAFQISRPDAPSSSSSSANLSVPRGDIVRRNDHGDSPSDQGRWWLRENGTKYLGGTCACASCRLASGFDVQTWIFVPQTHISLLDGSPLDLTTAGGSGKNGTLKRYNSSPGVYRDFCARCGATVFFHADRRPGLIDVSAGLLDAREGTRAESWIGWETERVSFKEDAQNGDLIRRLGQGLKQWGDAKASSSVGE